MKTPTSKRSALDPVPSNLIRQNCFTRECVHSSSSLSSPEKFFSCDQVVTDEGIRLECSEHPYPITPESVKSYADSCDYRTDPLAAASSAPRRKNLGDVSSLQTLGQMDMTQARSLYDQLTKLFTAEKSSPESSDSEQPSSEA